MSFFMYCSFSNRVKSYVIEYKHVRQFKPYDKFSKFILVPQNINRNATEHYILILVFFGLVKTCDGYFAIEFFVMLQRPKYLCVSKIRRPV